MVVRRRKRVNKLLGQRTRGNGDTKNRRGAGSRGGRGLAGSHKHKYPKYHGKFGTEKRKVLSRKIVREINIDKLIQILPKLIEAEKISKEAGMTLIDGSKIGFDKLLSKGDLDEKLLVRNLKASKKAVEKIEKAGGKFEEEIEGEEEFEAEEEAKEKPAKEKKTAKEPKEEVSGKKTEGKK